MSKQLTVCGVTIKQDAEGRYCLNDFHKAAGEVNHQRPSKWLDTLQAQELVTELEARNRATKAVHIRKGRGVTGTYVCKELVYAYAMWISPKFHLEVIRSYDRLVTEGVAVHKDSADEVLANPLKYMRAIIEQAERLQAEKAALQEVVEQEVEYMPVRQFEVRRLGGYLSQPLKQRLSCKARDFCKLHVLEVRRETMRVSTLQGEVESYTNLYPLVALEWAADHLGLR